MWVRTLTESVKSNGDEELTFEPTRAMIIIWILGITLGSAGFIWVGLISTNITLSIFSITLGVLIFVVNVLQLLREERLRMPFKAKGPKQFPAPETLNEKWLTEHEPHGLTWSTHTVFDGERGIKYRVCRCYKCFKAARFKIEDVLTTPVPYEPPKKTSKDKYV